MEKARRVYRGNEVDQYVTSATGKLMLAWVSDKDLVCTNCLDSIPSGTLFTLHTKHWFNVIWRHKNNQPYCRRCIAFQINEGE